MSAGLSAQAIGQLCGECEILAADIEMLTPSKPDEFTLTPRITAFSMMEFPCRKLVHFCHTRLSTRCGFEIQGRSMPSQTRTMTRR